MSDEEERYRYLQLKMKMGGSGSDTPPPSIGQKAMTYLKSGKYLPTVGAVIGGVAGSELGPGAIGTAALGGAAGEAMRQNMNRALGRPSPQTGLEAAKGIGIEGLSGAAGEAGGQVLGKLGSMAYKALPKIGQAISGTPAINIAKAQLRGFGETYFPKLAKGLSREVAGAEQGAIENRLLAKYYHPGDIAKMKLRKSGFADNIVESALTKRLQKRALNPKEALATVKSIDVIYRDTPLGAKVAPELAGLRKYAKSVVAKAHPDYAAAKQATEATILKSQLSKPFRVNKTRPDELSGFSGALGAFKPLAYLATMPVSPLGFGLTASALGSAKKAIPPLARKAIQRTTIQSLLKALRENANPNP